MDDNHFLSEWIAYHYYTTNLRTLIIATDPKSLTSPSSILEKWKDLIHIIEWNSDTDYFTTTEFVETQKDVKQYFSHTTPQLIEHRARQRLFYYKCMYTLKTLHKGWTLLLDTDEFIHINYETVNKYNMTNANVAINPITQPGSVATLLQDATTKLSK